jgi:probable HAF family extracellular repeat protein
MASHLGNTRLPEKRGNMKSFRQLRNSWIPCVATMVAACLGQAVAQTSYKITDLGTNKTTDNFSMAMGLNNQGWTLNMDGFVNPPENNLNTTVANGRAVINRDGVNIDLGTLGNPDTGNSWINWGGINDRGEAVGMSETSVPDPNGEDICGFGTFLTCVPFLSRNGHMSALPTVGGNNGQASAINNRGQVVGYAETANADPTCPPTPTILPVLWEKGQAQPLPTVGSDPDGTAFGINDLGQAVGYSGDCFNAKHAVMWRSGIAFPLQDLGFPRSNIGLAINNLGQIAGQVRKADGSARVAALWQPDGTLTVLGTLGQHASQATGINNLGQVVGSTFDSSPGWSGGFIWQNHVMTDLNTLIPADSNLFIINASNINERGQISGMAFVLAGSHTGEIRSILLTPVDESIDTSMADFARTHPHANLPANVCSQHLRRFAQLER